MLHRAVAVAVVAGGSAVHSLQQHYGHPLRSRHAVVVVGEPRESQPLQEGAHLSGHIAEIDRGTEHEAVGFGNLLQNGSQGILVFADVRGLAFEFAGHARHAALVVKVVEADKFHFCPAFFGAVGKGFQHGGGVHIAARTAVDNHYFLHIIRCFIVNHFVSRSHGGMLQQAGRRHCCHPEGRFLQKFASVHALS